MLRSLRSLGILLASILSNPYVAFWLLYALLCNGISDLLIGLGIPPWVMTISTACFPFYSITLRILVRFRELRYVQSQNTSVSVLPRPLPEYNSYLRERQNYVSLALLDIGKQESGVFINESTPRPLASVVKVMILAYFAVLATDGKIDPTRRISLFHIQKYHLPGMDGGAHFRSIIHLFRQRRVHNFKIQLQDAVDIMIKFSSNAAADFLIDLMGLDDINHFQDLHLQQSHSNIGYLAGSALVRSDLLLQNRGLEHARRALQQFSQIKLENRSNELARIYFRSHSVRIRWWARWAICGFGGNVVSQAVMLQSGLPMATALDYATLISKICMGTFVSSEASKIIRAVLEWPMEYESIKRNFSSLGYKGGALPGIMTSVYYARNKLSEAGTRVFVVFEEGMDPLMWQKSVTSFETRQACELDILSSDRAKEELHNVAAPDE